MPMRPSSKISRINDGSSAACSSIWRTRGVMRSRAKRRTVSRKSFSSAVSSVSGRGANSLTAAVGDDIRFLLPAGGEFAPGPTLRSGDGFISDVAAVDIHAGGQTFVIRAGPFETFVRELQKVRKCGVGEREGGGVRYRGGHVGNAIVQDVIDE